MNAARLAVALASVNAVLLAGLLVKGTPGYAAVDVAPILRAEKIELVDTKGTVRGSLGTEETGEVVLRLFDETGTVRVKLGADSGGSGILLTDESGDAGVRILAGMSDLTGVRATGITISDPDGKRRQIDLAP